MKLLIQLLVLLGLDFALAYFLKLRFQPETGVSLSLIVVVPAVFLANLILAVLLLFIKRKYAGQFAVNAFLASALVYHVFAGKGPEFVVPAFDTWTFQRNDTSFEVTLSRQDTLFSIGYAALPNASVGFLEGVYKRIGNTLLLTTGMKKLTIEGDHLYGFDGAAILLRKVEK